MPSLSDFQPALPPPKGIQSNFDDPETLKKWNNICISVCLSITTILFFLRNYVRLGIKREWTIEDCSFLSFTHKYVYVADLFRDVQHILGELATLALEGFFPMADQSLVGYEKAGLVMYCALMTTTMYRHGGTHAWDITDAEARQAVYVRTICIMRVVTC